MKTKNRLLALLFLIMATFVANAQESIGFIDSLRLKNEIQHFKFNSLEMSAPQSNRDVMYRMLIPQPKLQTYRVQPEAMRLKDDYFPVFPVSKMPISYGEYSVGGVIRQFGKGALIGSGSQENMISMGTLNTASFGYMHQFNPRLSTTFTVNTSKFSAPAKFNQSVGASGGMRYKLTDNITLNTFGSYDYNLNARLSIVNFGGSAEFDIIDKFGIEGGVQTFYDNWSNRWQTMPIVKPYYKISDDCKIGFDFGPIIQETIRSAIMKGHDNGGPTIMPPRMGFGR